MPYKFNPFTGSLDETGATGATGATGTVSAAGPGSAAAPGIAFASDTDTGLFNSAANELAISTNGTGRLFVASDGTVGIGQASDSASYRLNVFNPSADFCGVSIGNNVSGGGYTNGLIIGQNQADALFSNRENGFMSFGTNNTERARIDSSGRLLVGTTAALSTSSNALIQAVNTSGGEIVIGRDFALGSNSTIGRLAFFTKPSAVAEAARIEAVADAVHSGGAPTRLVFSTTADGAASPTERMRIKSDGDVSIVTGNLIIGTAGKGIDFSADGSAAGMTSELLDDYEEGTWTSTLGGSTSESGQTYLTRSGNYVKIGKKVTVEIYVELVSGGTGTVVGNAVLKGLPFSIAGSVSAQIMWNRTNINFVEVYLYGFSSGTTIGFYGATAAGTGTNSAITAANLYGNGFQVVTSFSYLTS